jgi:hypothetical protein
MTGGFAHSLVDRTAVGTESVLSSKTTDNRVEVAEVVRYDHIENIIWVKIANIADGKHVPVAGVTLYQGSKSGEGEIRSYYPGERVHVQFEGGQATGFYNGGIVTGGRYTLASHQPPAYGPWHQSGVGTAVKHPNGDASHTGTKTQSVTRGATQTNTEDWGHDYKVATGFNTTFSQKRTEEGRSGAAAALEQMV